MAVPDRIYGYTDGVILRCLEDGDNYGYEINRRIYERSGGRFELKEATLYTTFRRLEREGAIRSYWREDERSGGPRRRYYSLTARGREQLRDRRSEWAALRELIDGLLG